MALKRFIHIFTYLGAVFLMSHNLLCSTVSAIEPTLGVRFHSMVSDVYFQDGNSTTWRHSNAFYFYGNNADYGSNNRLFTLSNSGHSFVAYSGNYISVTGSFVAYSNIQDQFNASGTFGLSSQNSDCEVIDFDINNIQATNNSGTQQLTYKADFTLTCRLVSNVTVGPTLPLTVNTISNPGVSQVGILFTNFARWTADVANVDIQNSINNIYNYLQNQQSSADVLNQEKQDVQTNSNAAASSGSSSSSDAAAGTASLISTIGSAVSVISSASPTNCKLNGNMGNFDMGEIDLCANPVPTFVQIITSLLLILITVPLCIVLFNRFIGLFRSFQG